MALTISDRWHADLLEIALVGRLDTLTSKTFEDHLAGHLGRGVKTLVVNLPGVDYISSYGLRVFLQTAKKLRSDRNAFVLCGLSPDVAKIFQISGFDKILTIHPTLVDALGKAHHGDVR